MTDDLYGGIYWVPDADGSMVSATPGQCAAEIARLRERNAYLSRELMAIADKVQALGEMCGAGQ